MSFWSLENICAVVGGRWLVEPSGDVVARGVGTDTRALGPGSVFVALKGDLHDGHEHAAAAAAGGAVALIVSRGVDVGGRVPVMLVGDTREALGELARAYRRTIKARVVAVCGSNGKTTTVRLIDAALRGGGLVGTSSKKSFNNEIGVPLTILSAKDDDQFLICEVGSNAPGEIAALGAIVMPDVAVITSIGREHLAGFGDLAGVAREEGSIVRCLTPGGLAVLPADSAQLRGEVAGAWGEVGGGRAVWFGLSEGAGVRAVDIRHEILGDAIGLGFAVAGGPAVRLGMIGAHNACNALAALVVARELGVGDAQAVAGLAGAAGPEMRLGLSRVGQVTVINDAYNANPESMLAALRTLDAMGAGRKVAVLGDMLELGDAEGPSHAEVLAAACACAEVVLTIGPRFAQAWQRAGSEAGVDKSRPAHGCAYPAISAGVVEAIAGQLLGGDTVLLKGSRGMRMEGVLAGLATCAAEPSGEQAR